MSEYKLKPCPFCGGEVTVAEGSYCHVFMESKTYYFDSSEKDKERIKADLIEAWNKRVE